MITSTNPAQDKKPYHPPTLVKYGPAVRLTLGTWGKVLEGIFGAYRSRVSCGACGTCV